MGLSVEHQVNFEVNCRISASPIFMKFGGLVDPSDKSLNLKSRCWRHYGFMGNLKDV